MTHKDTTVTDTPPQTADLRELDVGELADVRGSYSFGTFAVSAIVMQLGLIGPVIATGMCWID
jgi:hypothetical protein